MPSPLLPEAEMGGSLRLCDVNILIQGCEGIPRMDCFGHADPYFVLKITTPDGAQTFHYKSSVIYNTGQPVWNEEIRLLNVPLGTRCFIQVVDKDHLTRDDPIGTCELALGVDEAAPATRRDQISTKGEIRPVTTRWPAGPKEDCCCCQLRLPIQPAPGVALSAGVLLLVLGLQASRRPAGPMLHCGPVRYRVTTSRVAGALTGHNREGCWSAFKLSLAGLHAFFPAGASVRWNTNYDKARQVFGSKTVVTALRAQHSLLYKDNGEQDGRGFLRGGGDLVVLLRGGVRSRQRRYFTYVLTEDGSFCFSETGAAFFADFMSKHAMHAACAERVVFAGEFCLLPGKQLPAAASDSDAASTSNVAALARLAAAEADAAVATAALKGVGGEQAGEWCLLIDNNSGTYAPPAEQLPALVALLEHNFVGLRIEALSEGDPRLAAVRARVPSRASA